MAHLLGSLAAWAAQHWKRSLAIVAVVLVAIGVGAGAAGGSFVDDFKTPGTESQAAVDVLQKRFPAASGDTANVVFAVDSGTLRTPKRKAAIERTIREIRTQPHVTGAPDPFAKGSGQLSENARIAYVPVQYDDTAAALGKDPGQRLEGASKLGERAGLEVSRNGAIVDQAEQATAPVGELIGVAVAVIVLTIVFGSAAAMALTLVSALIALAGGLLLLQFASAFADFPSFAPTLGIMLGLGAGIDYALLIVGRYREQLASGDSVGHSARVASATAGTSVVAAGAIVVVAIAGLLATGIPFVGKMGIGSAIIIAAVAVGAVTVLPTLMGAFARRLRPKRPEEVEPSQRFARWAGLITRRPLVATVVGVLVLLLLAMPLASLRLGQPDDGNDSPGTTTRTAYDRLAEGFGPGFNGPLVLAATTPTDDSGKTTLSRVQRTVAQDPDVAFVSRPQPSRRGDAAVLNVIPKSSPQDQATTDLVKRLRDDVLPGATRDSRVNVYVGGATATLQDLADKIAGRLPIFIAMVVGLSVLLLMAVFRSLWVPLVSAAFNLLSIAAAYGVVVLVFQDGVGSSLLGVDGEVPIVSFVPLFMFAILFGLSMDYNVFLQSRIREEYLRGVGPQESVVRAVSRVGKIILAAGVIMTSVFLGFVSDPDVVVKTIGLGLAAAILIDVLVVRMVVAPAVMTLLGDRAWTLPAWLDRVLPRISLEGELHDEGSPSEPARPEQKGLARHRPAEGAGYP
ncbi:MAG TPA: MMPL family transporter [Thermoleophilaceae bacterium]